MVRVITPGTLVEQNLMQGDENSYLASVVIEKEKTAMAFVDVSTGEFQVVSIENSIDLFRGELAKYNPREIVFKTDNEAESGPCFEHIRNSGIPLYRISEWFYDIEYMKELITSTFKIAGTSGLGLISDTETVATGAALQYLKETHAQTIENLKLPFRVNTSGFMTLDDATIKNLELVRNQNDSSKERSLFSVLDYTKTPMGKRLLEKNILQPLNDKIKIETRLNTVKFFFDNRELTGDLREVMKSVHDIERIISRLNTGKGNPKHFIALKNSLKAASDIQEMLQSREQELLKKITDGIPALGSLIKRIEDTIESDPALTPETGRVIKKGFNPEIDRLYEIKLNSKQWILDYQEEEKKALGLSTLKIKYNRVLGYYIELSRNQSREIPEEYLRKQTLVGTERYTTEKLQKLETEILSASDKIIQKENAEIDKLITDILNRRDELYQCAESVAMTDFFCSLAVCALENNYIMPEISSEKNMLIKDGRHPIVEIFHTKDVFIPNDVVLDSSDDIIKIITGPNMSGKSTYIRMCAIITLLAHTGSFVPAGKAVIPVTDRIFTRIGASDDISRGESTFLVEMNETAVILNNATEKSLIIMDEIGRGTSTYDGLSIAWSVLEYILSYIRANTLFATHYHELTVLESKKGVKNYTVMVKEDVNGIEFLHKVKEGTADRSYGIHVAQLAGIPAQVITRADRLLNRLEKQSGGRKKINPAEAAASETEDQLEIFNAANHRIIQTLRDLDIEKITPVEALNRLNEIKKLL